MEQCEKTQDNAQEYKMRFRRLQETLMRSIRFYLANEMMQVEKEQEKKQHDRFANANEESGTVGFAVSNSQWFKIYVGMRTLARKMTPVIREIESRVSMDQRYRILLHDMHMTFAQRRQTLLTDEINQQIQRITVNDLAGRTRALTSIMTEACSLELQLFSQFFSANADNSVLDDMLVHACSLLHTNLRASIISEMDIDMLCETCTILRYELVDQQHMASTSTNEVSGDNRSKAYVQILSRMIGDVQERLSYRCRVYIRDNIASYQNTMEDLDYPAKLKRHDEMNFITTQASTAVHRSSLSSTSTVTDTNQNDAGAMEKLMKSNREVMFATWHPVLERTLLTLSKLYRCLDPTAFKYLAQEAISVCTASLIKASRLISQQKPRTWDALLFLIKHLLLLREQISPFAIDFAITSKHLDFGHMKDVLPGIFSGGKFHGFIELLQQNAPKVVEERVDSKKNMENELKSACETLIATYTQYLVGPFLAFFNRLSQLEANGAMPTPDKLRADIIAIASQLSGQRVLSEVGSMDDSPFGNAINDMLSATSLYLTNPVTERVLFKPIRRTLADIFSQLKFFVQSHLPRSEQSQVGGPPINEVDSETLWLEDIITALELQLRKLDK